MYRSAAISQGDRNNIGTKNGEKKGRKIEYQKGKRIEDRGRKEKV